MSVLADDPAAESGPRARRRAETRREILDAAWRLARRDGLAAISLRDLGAEVGLRAQSLYAYFGSKGDLYDAMFRQGLEQLGEAVDFSDLPDGIGWDDAVAEAKRRHRDWAAFCTADPVRYQLLFQRTIPGWEPSAESYELAVAQLGALRSFLRSVGVTSERAVDLWTAIATGLTSQQVSNDPGGDRWLRLFDEAADMFFAHVDPRRSTAKRGKP